MVLPDQLSFIGLFSDHLKDLLLFYASIQEVNGIFGFHQDKFNSFQLETKLNNLLN
jgi:hypothetical protein